MSYVHVSSALQMLHSQSPFASFPSQNFIQFNGGGMGLYVLASHHFLPSRLLCFSLLVCTA